MVGVDGSSSHDNQHSDGVILVTAVTILGSLFRMDDDEEEVEDGEGKFVLFMLTSSVCYL